MNDNAPLAENDNIAPPISVPWVEEYRPDGTRCRRPGTAQDVRLALEAIMALPRD